MHACPPEWWLALRSQPEWLPMRVREWEDAAWRASSGWVGVDFVHGASAAVRVLEYVFKSDEPLQVVGAAHFRNGAESHKGLCHGGSMCALMDDIIGWTGFCVSGECVPWSGFTVQVNTRLSVPVPVGAWLKVEAQVERCEGKRKVWIRSKLSDPNDGTVHCTAEGLFLRSAEANARGTA